VSRALRYGTGILASSGFENLDSCWAGLRMLPGVGNRWNGEEERGALSDRAADPNAAAVGLHNTLDDVKSQPGAPV